MGKSQVQWQPFENAQGKNCISDQERIRFKNKHRKYFNMKPLYSINDVPNEPNDILDNVNMQLLRNRTTRSSIETREVVTLAKNSGLNTPPDTP